MAHPILDPSTGTEKDSHIKKLIEEVEQIRVINVDLSEGFRS